MTLDEATALCRQWLPREHKEHWEPKQICQLENCGHQAKMFHYAPMPPANWELAGAMLDALDTKLGGYFALVHCDPTKSANKPWVFDRAGKEMGEYVDKPLDAILIASAEWIQAQEQR